MPRFRKGFSGIRAFEPRLSSPRSHPTRPDLPRAGLPVPLRRHAGEEPAGRAGRRAHQLRLIHAPRHDRLGAAHRRRRADHLSARNRSRDDEHVSSARDRGRTSSRRAGRPGCSIDSRSRPTSCSRRRGRPPIRDRGQAATAEAPDHRSSIRERQLLQHAGTSRSQLPVGRVDQPHSQLARRARRQDRRRRAVGAIRRVESETGRWKSAGSTVRWRSERCSAGRPSRSRPAPRSRSLVRTAGGSARA